MQFKCEIVGVWSPPLTKGQKEMLKCDWLLCFGVPEVLTRLQNKKRYDLEETIDNAVRE